MQYNTAFASAAAELDDLVKSKRRRSQTIQSMSDAKDYADADLDEFDRAPQGARRKDMRESNDEWQGIQALDDYYAQKWANDEQELDELEHTMLVSGRRAKIRFPGAKRRQHA